MRERKGGENTFKKKKDRKARKEKPDQSVRTDRNSLIAAHKFRHKMVNDYIPRLVSVYPCSHYLICLFI